MRTLIFILIAGLLPDALEAQPTIYTNEFYSIGDVIQMVNSDATFVTAGAAGAGVVWDFSLLSGGPVSTTLFTSDHSSVFATSNVLEIPPGGKQVHLSENSTDTYINGIEDSTSLNSTTYLNYRVSRRPISYLSAFLDSYRVTSTTPPEIGTGRVTEVGDGYGTLVLPAATYNNVLRVRRVITESDTEGAAFIYSTTISYLWFDDVHHAPLLRIDTVIDLTGMHNTVMYLATPSGVANINGYETAYSGHLDDEELLLNGNFVAGAVYEVRLLNMTGAQVLKQEYISYNKSSRVYLDVNTEIPPGIYIVNIMQRDEPKTMKVFEVVKD